MTGTAIGMLTGLVGLEHWIHNGVGRESMIREGRSVYQGEGRWERQNSRHRNSRAGSEMLESRA